MKPSLADPSRNDVSLCLMNLQLEEDYREEMAKQEAARQAFSKRYWSPVRINWGQVFAGKGCPCELCL